MAKYRRRLSNLLVIKEIMRDTTLTKNAKLVGVALANHRNLSDLTCCPSQETLGTMCLIKDPKQVRAAIKLLVERKYIVVTKGRRQGSEWDHNQYYFLRDWAAQRELSKSDEFKGDRTLFGFAGMKT